MKISSLNTTNRYYVIKDSFYNSKFRNFGYLHQDTISFSGNNIKVKKSDFKGIDFDVIEKYKVDISKFKSVEDLQTWAGEQVKHIIQHNWGGRSSDTISLRKDLLNEWINYITKENDAYTPVIQFAILDSITKNLKRDNDYLPPVLNKGALAYTISELSERLNTNPKDRVNINKLYQKNFQNIFFNTVGKEENSQGYTGWIEIPSESNDYKNFKENVDKLKSLSHKNWCTKSYNAESYLRFGDFHVYLENGQPKLGVRYIDELIHEIQGPANNNEIPQKYFGIFQKYLNNRVVELDENADRELDIALFRKRKIDSIKKEIGEVAIKNCDAEKILPHLKISVEKDEDGLLIISDYVQQPDYILDVIGVDENKLFKQIKEIKGNADFRCSNVKDLGCLEKIGGHVEFSNSNISCLKNLKTIGGRANFNMSQISDLGKLETIGGDLLLERSLITSLKNLHFVGGNASFRNSVVTDLGNLEEIRGDLLLERSMITSLKNLNIVHGDVDFANSQVTDLGKLKFIGGNSYFNNSSIKNLGNIEYIGGDVYFEYGHKSDLSNCKIHGSVYYYY